MGYRVLFGTYPAAFFVPGGGEVQLGELARELDRIGDTVEYFDAWQPHRQTADLVHYFSVMGGSVPFCRAAKQKWGKLVVSPGIWIEDPSRYPMDEIRQIFALADAVIPNSALEKENLLAYFPGLAARMYVVSNGIRPEVFRCPDPGLFRRAYGLDDYLLCVANIEPRKNQLRTIRAIEDPEVCLVFVGHVRDEEYGRACREAARRLPNVRFIEPLEHDSAMLVSAYAGAKAVILPSLLETPGLAALEAVAAGVPQLLVTAVGSAREYFGESVDYIENPADEAELKLKIDRVWQGQGKPAATLAGYIGERFAWRVAARQLHDIYRLVAGG